jgi:hypothetical protein
MNIEQAFNVTFKLIFGECNLKLDDLAEYMQRWHYPIHMRKSSVSGREVALSTRFYRKDATYVSQDEMNFSRKYALDVNKIRDIDSILEQIQDRTYYAGNKSFGSSSELEDCDTCTDVTCAKAAHHISGTKYAAYCSYVRYGSEYVFGSGWFLRSKHLIRCMGADSLTRAFECYVSPQCSDAFFCFNCWASSHIMFSFNQRSKRYCIGNNELPKDRYFELRKKLVDESREYLEKHKEFPSIFEPTAMTEKQRNALLAKAPKTKEEECDLSQINEAFKTTSRVIFGAEIGTVDENKQLLTERPDIPQEVTTFFRNNGYYPPVFFFKQIPKDRMINGEEEQVSAEAKISLSAEESFASIIDKMGDISLYRIDMREGKISNIIKSSLIYHGINAYYVDDLTFGKNCAYCTFALTTEAVFGSFRAIHSKFCIRCESPYNCTACFECDSCTNCSNCYYCHNCEGCSDCMFCFNVKSLHYAIGNVELGKEQYMKIREMVLKELIDQIKNGKLKNDIYSLGCRKDD